jgi:hypothetical protein
VVLVDELLQQVHDEPGKLLSAETGLDDLVEIEDYGMVFLHGSGITSYKNNKKTYLCVNIGRKSV